MSWMRKKIIRKLPEKEIVELKQMILSGAPGEIRSRTIEEPEKRKEAPVTKDELETLYLIDGLTGRIVDKYIEKMLSGGYILKGDPEICKEIEEWCEQIDLKYLLGEIIRDIFITGNGNAWCELGYTENGKDITTIVMINPKNIDYLRDDQNKILYDTDLRPKGFKLGTDLSRPLIIWEKDKITIKGEEEKIIRMPPGQDGRDRIAHFKLIGLGEYELGISPIARSFKAALIRLNMEDLVGNIAFRSGAVVARVGTEEQSPDEISDEVLENTKNTLAESLDQKTIYAFRRNIELDTFPVPKLDAYTDLLWYFAGLYSGSAGIKLPLILETRRGYRGDIEVAQLEFLDTLKWYQERLAHQVREFFFKRLLKARGRDPKKAPKIEFLLQDPRINLSKARRLATYARRGLLRWDPELELYIRKLEGLPTSFTEKVLEEWKRKGRVPEEGKEVDVSDL